MSGLPRAVVQSLSESDVLFPEVVIFLIINSVYLLYSALNSFRLTDIRIVMKLKKWTYSI